LEFEAQMRFDSVGLCQGMLKLVSSPPISIAKLIFLFTQIQ